MRVCSTKPWTGDGVVAGEAEAILKKADATADSIRRVATALEEAKRSGDAVALTVADKYIEGTAAHWITPAAAQFHRSTRTSNARPLA